jgi:hypothetical protein
LSDALSRHRGAAGQLLAASAAFDSAMIFSASFAGTTS